MNRRGFSDAPRHALVDVPINDGCTCVLLWCFRRHALIDLSSTAVCTFFCGVVWYGVVFVKILELFEVPPDGVVTRKEFVDHVVDIFVQRRSLQLTLADYEVSVGLLLQFVFQVQYCRCRKKSLGRALCESRISSFLSLWIVGAPPRCSASLARA